MAETYHGRNMVRHIGRCIYCLARPEEGKLTNEHIVPFALGADSYLEEASCENCRKITADFETHLGRNVFGQLRIHTGVQTRRPKQRPTALPTRIRRGDRIETHLLAIPDHPNSLLMPVWEGPGALRGAQSSTDFPNLHGNLYHAIPATTGEAVGLGTAENLQWFPDFWVDTPRFARAIVKIAYCQAIGIFGLEGFRRITAVSDIILGKYVGISQFVGTHLGDPGPPERRGIQHKANIYDVRVTERLRLLLAQVRLFADSGTPEHGLPIYTVVVGVPKDDPA